MSNAQTPAWLATCFAQQEAAQDWLRTLQHTQRESVLQRGLPVRKDERWKYNDISFLTQKTFTLNTQTVLNTSIAHLRLQNSSSALLVLINGKFSAEFSDLTLLPANVTVKSLAAALQTHSELIEPRLPHDSKKHLFASLNTALLSDGVFVFVPDNVQVSAPIHILHINTAPDYLINTRTIVLAGKNSAVKILEEHQGVADASYFANVVTDIEAGANSLVDFHKIQNESAQAAHIAQLFINARQDAVVTLHTLALGGHLAREDVTVNLNAPGAACQLNGFYYANADQQQIDNHILVDHRAPHSVSEMLYKGIADKKSNVIFNGKIHVHKDAQKIQSNQYNHNLLLSTDAQVNTKPELEIYADDVKCAHGATIGQFDEESLFYLRARGIPHDLAMSILTHAFAGEVLAKIGCQSIKQKITELLNVRFSHVD